MATGIVGVEKYCPATLHKADRLSDRPAIPVTDRENVNIPSLSLRPLAPTFPGLETTILRPLVEGDSSIKLQETPGAFFDISFDAILHAKSGSGTNCNNAALVKMGVLKSCHFEGMGGNQAACRTSMITTAVAEKIIPPALRVQANDKVALEPRGALIESPGNVATPKFTGDRTVPKRVICLLAVGTDGEKSSAITVTVHEAEDSDISTPLVELRIATETVGENGKG